MSQPPFQPPQQPPQPPQAPQYPANPYAQPSPPPAQQQSPGFGPPAAPQQPPMQAAPPPVPGQPAMYGGQQAFPGQPAYPMQPPPPYQPAPFAQQPHAGGGNPVGAVLLGFLVSFVVALLYTGLIVATYRDQSTTTANVLYFAHALLNGAVVGALVGKMAHRSNGARVGGAIVAALGTFFGYADALPVIVLKEQSFMALKSLLEAQPFFPAKAWWNDEAHGGVDWLMVLGLVVAAVAVWGVAHLVASRRRPT
ncbi:hypothetical protein ACIRJO_43635 [Streptomyces sp. NPDC102394]|uniref:hypothetical protein n=1 Tax=Streptomyces sp. NPDC102394 TaxID=3366167 RepID=UPI0037FE2024